MRAVWKFELGPTETELNLPVGAQPLSVAMQGGAMCLWVLLDPDATHTTCRRFLVVGTGHQEVPDMDTPVYYVGTLHGVGGWMVFHVFEVVAA